jgi:hypothetical protein
MVKRDRNELVSYLKILIAHLLKWQFQLQQLYAPRFRYYVTYGYAQSRYLFRYQTLLESVFMAKLGFACCHTSSPSKAWQASITK